MAELESSGEDVPRDPFGHVKIDKVKPGEWFASKFSERIGAQKVMVQKSGYGKPFDLSLDWFGAMLDGIGQSPAKAAARH